jgi:hypothetical protein
MRSRVIAAAALATLLAAGAAHATTFVAADFSQLVLEADAIAHGRVVALRAQWAPGTRREIETIVTLHVSNWLKGGMGDTVDVRVPGGEVGAYRSVFVGAPVFREGDEVVLMLRGNPPALPHVLGLSQGAFRVTSVPGGEARVVTPPIVMAQDPAARVVRGDPTRRPIGVEAFGEEVRQILASPAAARVRR